MTITLSEKETVSEVDLCYSLLSEMNRGLRMADCESDGLHEDCYSPLE